MLEKIGEKFRMLEISWAVLELHAALEHYKVENNLISAQMFWAFWDFYVAQ
jgi:hypothetical protein